MGVHVSQIDGLAEILPTEIPSPIVSVMTGGEAPSVNNGTLGVGAKDMTLLVSYPNGYSAFEALVQSGQVRLQLVQVKPRATYRHGKTISGNYTPTNKWKAKQAFRYVIHQNGINDVGDYYFASPRIAQGGITLPPVNGMKMLPTSLKPTQKIEFILNCNEFYGHVVSGFGDVHGMMPIRESVASVDTAVRRKMSIIGTPNKYFANIKKYNTRTRFCFVFMYKKNGKWMQGEMSNQFYLDLKYSVQNTGWSGNPSGNERFWHSFMLKLD